MMIVIWCPQRLQRVTIKASKVLRTTFQVRQKAGITWKQNYNEEVLVTPPHLLLYLPQLLLYFVQGNKDVRCWQLFFSSFFSFLVIALLLDWCPASDDLIHSSLQSLSSDTRTWITMPFIIATERRGEWMKRRSVKHEDDEHDDRNDADAFDGFFSKRVGGFKERISQSRQVTGGKREKRCHHQEESHTVSLFFR